MADLLSDGVIAKLRAGLKGLPPGPWDTDSVRMDDAPDRHYEYELLDARGYRLCDTENCDYRFGTIAFDYDEDGSSAWNEPARQLMDHITRCDPATIGALLDTVEVDRAARKAAEATIADLEARLAAAEARAATEFERGLRAGAKVIADRRDAYIEEHGSVDYETGVTEFPGNGEETVGEWDELEEAILAKIPSPTPAGEAG